MKAQQNLIMPNYNKEQKKSVIIRETITTNDDNLENRYFFLSFVVVLIVAALLLLVTVVKEHDHIRLPNKLSNLATQLSIISDEIVMLQNMELISSEPDLSELIDNQLSPFDTETVVQAGKNCFVIEKGEVMLRLMKFNSQAWKVHWRPLTNPHNHHQKLTLNHSENLCEVNQFWQPVGH